MPQQNVLELAKQGNVKAIATLMNRSLQPKGITVVKAAFKDNRFEILLESAQVPNQQTLVAFVRQRITRLRAAPIKQVKLYVRQIGEEFPAWSQEIEVAGQPLPPVMSHPSPVQLVKEGNVKAIAALMNRSLQPQGITLVRATFKDSCLQILLESAQVPHQQELVAFIRKQVKGLDSASIKQVNLYVRQTGEEFPAWSQEIEFAGQPLPPVKPQPSPLELAQQGNVEAIAALMNRSLQPKGITVVRSALKDSCLQILLESAQVPNQQALVAFVEQGLTRLGAASIKQVKLYGRQTGEEFPAWSQEFEKHSNGSSHPNNTALPTTNYVDNTSGENNSAKPFVSNAHQKFWQLPSLARFGVIGIILLVVSLNIFIIFNSNQMDNLNAENITNSIQINNTIIF